MGGKLTSVLENAKRGKTQPRVFFDGACPICSREIGFYRGRRGAERIDWVDVSSPVSAELPPGLDRSTLLARFHVIGSNGCVRDGAEAFVALWSELPGFRWAARIAGTRPVLPILERLYLIFLKFRRDHRGKSNHLDCL